MSPVPAGEMHALNAFVKPNGRWEVRCSCSWHTTEETAEWCRVLWGMHAVDALRSQLLESAEREKALGKVVTAMSAYVPSKHLPAISQRTGLTLFWENGAFVKCEPAASRPQAGE